MEDLQPKKLCTECFKGNPADTYCFKCLHYLCRLCTFSHRRMIQFKSHIIVPVEFDDVKNISPNNGASEGNTTLEGKINDNKPIQLPRELNDLTELHANCLQYIHYLYDGELQHAEDKNKVLKAIDRQYEQKVQELYSQTSKESNKWGAPGEIPAWLGSNGRGRDDYLAEDIDFALPSNKMVDDGNPKPSNEYVAVTSPTNNSFDAGKSKRCNPSLSGSNDGAGATSSVNGSLESTLNGNNSVDVRSPKFISVGLFDSNGPWSNNDGLASTNSTNGGLSWTLPGKNTFDTVSPKSTGMGLFDSNVQWSNNDGRGSTNFSNRLVAPTLSVNGTVDINPAQASALTWPSSNANGVGEWPNNIDVSKSRFNFGVDSCSGPRNTRSNYTSTSQFNPSNFALVTENRDSLNSVLIRKSFGKKGTNISDFNSPRGLCFGFDEEILIADTDNHRIQIFNKDGRYKRQFGQQGKAEGYLYFPRKVALIPSQSHYVICDRGSDRSRIQVFSIAGNFIRRIKIENLDVLAAVFVTEDESILFLESVKPTIFIVEGNSLGTIDCSPNVEEPSDIAALNNEYYISDFKGHCVVVLDKDGNFLRRFGNQKINFPNGIFVSSTYDFVATIDSHGNYPHIVAFKRNGDLITDVRCNCIKVSRCCCLKFTTENRMVTVDKNYHCVLIFHPLNIDWGSLENVLG